MCEITEWNLRTTESLFVKSEDRANRLAYRSTSPALLSTTGRKKSTLSFQSRIPIRVGSSLSINSVGLSSRGTSEESGTPNSSTSASPHSCHIYADRGGFAFCNSF